MSREDKPLHLSALERDAKLAEALRANLRRRKAAKPAPKPSVDEKRS